MSQDSSVSWAPLASWWPPWLGGRQTAGGARSVVMLGAACALVAWLVMLGWSSLAGLVAGVIILDFGVQSSLIAHQQMVYSLRPEAKNRVNTLFMVGMFLGGSFGAAAAMLAWKTYGWCGVGTFAIALCLLASLILLLDRTSSKGGSPPEVRGEPFHSPSSRMMAL